jgi:hypothetical protein
MASSNIVLAVVPSGGSPNRSAPLSYESTTRRRCCVVSPVLDRSMKLVVLVVGLLPLPLPLPLHKSKAPSMLTILATVVVSFELQYRHHLL